MGQNQESVLQQIDVLRKKDIAASKAYNLEELASLWDDEGVLLPPGQTPVVGIEAIRSKMAQASATASTLEVLDYDEIFEETIVCGDYAFEWGYITGSERQRPAGPIQQSRFKVVRILKRQPDGSWRVRLSMFNQAG